MDDDTSKLKVDLNKTIIEIAFEVFVFFVSF